MASLTEPSLDEDIPDNVSITLVLHADSAGLDSPTKESMKMQLHSKMDPEQPQQEVGSFSFRTSPEGFETLPIISTQETPTKRAAALPADTMDTFPAIEHIHQALSTKVMSSQQKEEPKHRSRSMIVSGTSADSSGAPPPNSSLDRKKSPSEKFRSFMKSFAPVRNESMESFGENDEDLTLGGGELSIKVGTPFKSSGSSKKFFSPEEETAQKSALKARIARVQEEQAKFRLSQKVRMHHGSPHSASNSFKEQAKEKEKARKAKAPKSGLAPCFSNALLGGLRRSEFRETRELGAAMLKHTHRHRLGDDLFNADSLPMSHLGLDLGLGVGLDLQADSDSAAAEATAAEATSSSDRRTRTYTPDPMPPPLILPRMYRVPSEHSVTLTGDEYMSEEDWRITNREQQQKRKAALLGTDCYTEYARVPS